MHAEKKRLDPLARLVRAFFAVDCGLCIAYLANAAAGEPFWKITTLLDLEGENNIPAWYSSMQLFVVACLFGLFARASFDRRQWRSWLLALFPLILLAMSCDEIAQVHEWLGEKSDVLFASGSRLGSRFWYTGVWMFVIGVPFTLGVGLLFLQLTAFFRQSPGATIKFLAGLLVFAGSAVGVEALANFTLSGTLARTAQVSCEEFGEMLGVTIWLSATCDLLRASGFRIRWQQQERSRVRELV